MTTSLRWLLLSQKFRQIILVNSPKIMPIVKVLSSKKPLWIEWDRQAQKSGIRHTVFSVNGDQYTGEWQDNKKHGR